MENDTAKCTRQTAQLSLQAILTRPWLCYNSSYILALIAAFAGPCQKTPACEDHFVKSQDTLTIKESKQEVRLFSTYCCAVREQPKTWRLLTTFHDTEPAVFVCSVVQNYMLFSCKLYSKTQSQFVICFQFDAYSGDWIFNWCIL